jgi:hypothetical protein
MGKIIQFRLPDVAKWQLIGPKAPVKRDNPPPRRQKEPIIISVMPEQAFPTGHQDLRPLLQRDGLILLSWAIWEDWYHDESFQRRYIVTWTTSQGKASHYATEAIPETELIKAAPERRADTYFYRGAYGNYFDMYLYSDNRIADYLYLTAPFDLKKHTIPTFVRVLKSLGSTVNFDLVYSLGRQREKNSKAQEYLDRVASTQVI